MGWTEGGAQEARTQKGTCRLHLGQALEAVEQMNTLANTEPSADVNIFLGWSSVLTFLIDTD